jgi:hypothetical protein
MQYKASSIRLVFFSSKVAKPAIHTQVAMDIPLLAPKMLKPAHTPAKPQTKGEQWELWASSWRLCFHAKIRGCIVNSQGPLLTV